MNFPHGSEVTVTATFTRKATGTLADPDSPRITVTPPRGRPIVHLGGELTHVGPGTYSIDVDLADRGDWKVRGWSPSGDSVQGASPEVRFTSS